MTIALGPFNWSNLIAVAIALSSMVYSGAVLQTRLQAAEIMLAKQDGKMEAANSTNTQILSRLSSIETSIALMGRYQDRQARR